MGIYFFHLEEKFQALQHNPYTHMSILLVLDEKFSRCNRNKMMGCDLKVTEVSFTNFILNFDKKG